ncbi:MAG TPA: HEPN domain-containing protein [Acidobacteriaceae bacterium]|nr:HEPN domain-containing protein [Acidobacteriaceae bacterium]
MPDNLQTQLPLHKAAEDRAAIDFDLPDSIFGFHAQQAIEKLLKALIAWRGDTYPHTHDLRQLSTLCIESGEQLPVLPWSVINLQEYAVLLRYDTSDILPPADRDKIRSTVDILAAFVRARVLPE